MVKRSITGRPFKYGHILGYLQDDQLYTPATIARLVIPSWRKDKKMYTKVRHAFVGFAARKHLKTAIDGTVRVGKRTNPAWFGKTWKAEVEPADLVTPEPDMTLSQLRSYWLAKLGPQEIPEDHSTPAPRIPNTRRYLWVAASIFLIGTIWVWQATDTQRLDPEPMTLLPESSGVAKSHRKKAKKMKAPGHVAWDARETDSSEGVPQPEPSLPETPKIVQLQKEQTKEKKIKEYAAFSRQLLEQRRTTPKSRRLAVPYDPEQLSSWQSPVQKPEQYAAGPGQPTTIYLLNARGAGLFPE